MPTKLSRFCLGVMEAAWLAAVCVIPIFFNIYSSRIFEPDKITILRSLAILTLAAWVIKLVEEGGIKWKTEASGASVLKYLWNYPLIAPVLGLIIVYSLSTIFSVTPSISFFGSWQRLQGTYTTLSYLVIFLSILANLRKREQINRLVTTIIIASLPVSLYGLLQKYQIDPIPWGGNVSIRIAANMGNSIFVAAYLIMVFPLTIGRMVDAFRAILSDGGEVQPHNASSMKHLVRATIYVFIAALELIAIYMSGSRGPLLGLLAGIYFVVLLFSIYWRKRWLTFTVIGLAILGAGFLAIFNMRNGPLEALKSSSAIGRFGNLLNPESNSALVRQYIWEGTVKLVGIHDPLKFPDGSSDKFNFLRPIIGYGPETMYVAYNQFYEPELGQVEKRNASPDRAHNETWDSIVITGFSGLLVYLSIFSSLFYYGLKWQGLINTQRNKLFFFVCLVGGGIIGAISLMALKGVEFLGVGLPFGMIVGVVLYLTGYVLFSLSNMDQMMHRSPYTPLMIVLFGALIGHFAEINFGIAIVATRTLFWTYAGLTIVLGYILPKTSQSEERASAIVDSNVDNNLAGAKKKKMQSRAGFRRNIERNKRPVLGDQPDWLRNALIGAIIMGVILVTMGYDYVTNASHSTSFLTIVFDSVTRLANHDNAVSFGVIFLIFLSWLTGILLFAAENDDRIEAHPWWHNLGIMSVISLTIGVMYWILHGISLAILASSSITSSADLIAQVGNIGTLLSKYYLYMFFIILFAAIILPDEWPGRSKLTRIHSLILIPVILIAIFFTTNISNLRVIDADITFKMAEPFTKNNQWDIATILYQRSLELTPREDHYYLFLGRSYLEQAKITEKTADQNQLILKAENDLTVAQSINPLNTDHTANLARLYSWWAGDASDASSRADRAQKASDYYATSLTLSPNNSTLWDEWAIVYLNLLNQPQKAISLLNHALDLDQKYNFTQGLFGDYYLKVANSTSDATLKEQALQTALGYYRIAADVSRPTDTISKANYLLSLGNVYALLGTEDPKNINRAQLQQAIDSLTQAIDAGLSSNDLWKVQQAIANLYLQLGDKLNAQYYAFQALQSAPSAATSQIQDLITQTQSLP